MDRTSRTGLVLAVPAIIKFQFIKPPKKAAIAVKRPRMSAIPIRISPATTSLANQTWELLSSKACRNERYQSKAMAGRAGASGMRTALVQKPLSASPVATQAGLLSLPIPEDNHW